MPTIAAPSPGRIRRRPAPVTPRRGSGTATPRRRATDLPAGPEPLALRLRRLADGVSSARLLDTIIHRRLWIPGLAVALIGIVFIQVLALGYNAQIGRTVERSVLLERQNTALAAEVSRLESADRLGTAVAGMGLTDPVPGTTRYMRADGTIIPVSGDGAGTAQVAAAPAAAQPDAAAPQQAPAAQAAAPAAAAQPVATDPATAAAPEQAPVTAGGQAAAPAAAQPAAATPPSSAGGAAAPVAPTAAVGVH